MSADFENFAHDVRLPHGDLTHWEQKLRFELLSVLSSLAGRPLPLTDWIDCRVGAEIETLKDQSTDAIWIRLRGGDQGAPVEPRQDEFFQSRRPERSGRGILHAVQDMDMGVKGGKGKSKGKEKGKDKDMDLGAKGGKDRGKDDIYKRESFWAKLPQDSLLKEEAKLRLTIFEFLAAWQSTEKATLIDLESDTIVVQARKNFMPKVVSLKDWIEMRIGGEIMFRTDRRGQDVLEVTPSAKKFIIEIHRTQNSNVPPAFVGERPVGVDKQQEQSAREIEEGAPQFSIELQNICGKLTQTPLKKGWMKHEIEKDGEMYIATVCLACLDGERFTGHACAQVRDAKESANEEAVRVLMASNPDLQLMRKRKREGPADIDASGKKRKNLQPIDITPPFGKYKGTLEAFCRRLHSRNLVKGDIVQTLSNNDDDQFVTHIQLNFLNGEEFTGDPAASEADARENACQLAVDGIADQILDFNKTLLEAAEAGE